MIEFIPLYLTEEELEFVFGSVAQMDIEFVVCPEKLAIKLHDAMDKTNSDYSPFISRWKNLYDC